jgi:hypothetical protein
LLLKILALLGELGEWRTDDSGWKIDFLTACPGEEVAGEEYFLREDSDRSKFLSSADGEGDRDEAGGGRTELVFCAAAAAMVRLKLPRRSRRDTGDAERDRCKATFSGDALRSRGEMPTGELRRTIVVCPPSDADERSSFRSSVLLWALLLASRRGDERREDLSSSLLMMSVLVTTSSSS